MFGIPVMGSVAAGTVDVFGAGSVTAGTVGNVKAMVGVTVMVGTAAAELTPRLPISVEPIAMPVRGTPPGVVGDVGVDDAARLPDPAPHMLWVPDVSIRADVGEMPDDCIAIVLCVVTVPTGMPPPSKLDADPNIVDGAVPMVEHTVLPMMPVEGSGAGLTPGEVISVAPNGMPVPPTGAPGTMPSGEVAESEGVGITAACCAMAWPQSSAEAVVIIRKRFMVVLRCRSSSVTNGKVARRRRDIGPGYSGDRPGGHWKCPPVCLSARVQDLREGLSCSSAARAGRDAGSTSRSNRDSSSRIPTRIRRSDAARAGAVRNHARQCGRRRGLPCVRRQGRHRNDLRRQSLRCDLHRQNRRPYGHRHRSRRLRRD